LSAMMKKTLIVSLSGLQMRTVEANYSKRAMALDQVEVMLISLAPGARHPSLSIFAQQRITPSRVSIRSRRPSGSRWAVNKKGD